MNTSEKPRWETLPRSDLNSYMGLAHYGTTARHTIPTWNLPPMPSEGQELQTIQTMFFPFHRCPLYPFWDRVTTDTLHWVYVTTLPGCPLQTCPEDLQLQTMGVWPWDPSSYR